MLQVRSYGEREIKTAVCTNKLVMYRSFYVQPPTDYILCIDRFILKSFYVRKPGGIYRATGGFDIITRLQ